MFSQPILIYSNHCAFSGKFIGLLSRFSNIFKDFVKINIDIDSNGKRNPDFYNIQQALQVKISEVPTIIVNNNNENYVLSGEEAFKWLEYQIKSNSIQAQPKKTPSELSGFNVNEMGAFSDQYSNFGSNDLHDAKDQSFVFIGKQYESITTPLETESVNKPQNNDNQNTGFYGINNDINNKFNNIPKSDTDKRFEELMAQRQNLDKPANNGPKQIDFATGKIIM